MKIAYFSPMPPAKTGIATYSSYLAPALAKRCELTVFAPGDCDCAAPEMPVFDFKADPYIIKTLPDYDRIVYHIGNNPHFHLDIYKVLLQFRGIVVLHDLVLYFLAAGQGNGGLIKEFCENYGPEELDHLWEIYAESPSGDVLRYGNPANYPLIGRVLARADAVIVHNNTSAAKLAQMGLVCNVHVIPNPCYPDQMKSGIIPPGSLRSHLRLPQAQILIGIFGFIGPTKRIDKVFQAVRTLLNTTPDLPIKILIVGEGAPLTDAIRDHRLHDRVIETGFVTESAFRDFLTVVDIVVNLRYPSMGESSASLIQAMSFGKPVIVTNDASFAELPDDVVAKVSYGSHEIFDIAHSLMRLIESAAERERLGEAARRYVEEHCSLDKVADRYVDVLSALDARGERDAEEIPSRWGESYLRQRLGEIILD